MSESENIDKQKLEERAAPIVQVTAADIFLNGEKLSRALLKHLKKPDKPDKDEKEQA